MALNCVIANQCARTAHFMAYQDGDDRCVSCGLLIRKGQMCEVIRILTGGEGIQHVQVIGLLSG